MSPVPPLDLSPQRPSPLGDLDFATTAELTPAAGPIGQERALEALALALDTPRQGYNAFVFGPVGSGRTTAVRHVLAARAAEAPTPPDWCYVQCFSDPHTPVALRLPAGRGKVLRDRMQRLIEDLETVLPAAFEADAYKARLSELEDELSALHQQAFNELKAEAEARGLALVRTPVGFAFAPVKDGGVLEPDAVDALPPEERARIGAALDHMQERLQAILKQVPRWRKDARERVRELNQAVATLEVEHLVTASLAEFADLPDVVAHLEAARDDIIAHVEAFLQPKRDAEPTLGYLDGDGVRRRYAVNLLVEHEADSGAPVVVEDLPTLMNLLGRVEYVSKEGVLMTDMTLIRAGALHRANGGYLVLDVRRLLSEPYAWDGLKRVLSSGQIQIESLAQRLSLVSTLSLKPAPIPLALKVVLIGEPWLYYLLSAVDPDLRRHFKVAADFDDRVARTPDNLLRYARFIAHHVTERGLLPLERGAVARVVERAMRWSGDAGRLSTDLERLVELLEEADHLARRAGASTVGAEHVAAAVLAREHQQSRPRDRLFEAIAEGTLRIVPAGREIGQIHGLAVMSLGDYRFGRPSRITATCRLGRGEVVDIEREATLGGELHSKGVLILGSHLGRRYARDHALSLRASLVFEQSYGRIDGDSASLAELCALLSAIGEVPLLASIAVTGSVDQLGRVQAIGGVNEKVEGFFQACRDQGFPGDDPHGVIIPESNVRHLVLSDALRAAAAERRFFVWAVRDVDEAMALLTGLEPGARGEDGLFPPGTVNRRVEDRLIALAERRHHLDARDGSGRPGP